MGLFGMHASPWFYLWIWIEALYLQICTKLFSMKGQWEKGDAGDKVVFITGASSGLGLALAKDMAKRGATVILGVRNTSLGEAGIEEIIGSTGCSASQLSIAKVDLSDLASIRECATSLISILPHLDILINNAGVSLNTSKRLYTKDGFELHMGVNHLGHFLLTSLLLPLLHRAPKTPRVVNIISTALSQSNLDPDDMSCQLCWRGIGYTIHYANSKHAIALFSSELAKREQGRILSYAVCPGFVKDTKILRDYKGRRFGESFINAIGLSLEEGIKTIIYCALAREVEARNGKLFRFGRRWGSGEFFVENRNLAVQVWRRSAEMVGLDLDLDSANPNG